MKERKLENCYTKTDEESVAAQHLISDFNSISDHNISSTALDFLISLIHLIFLFSLEHFFSSSCNWYAIHRGVGLVFLLPNSLKPDWSSVTAFDLPSQTSVAEVNISLTSLYSSPILPSDRDLFLFNCTLLSDISVTTTGLANLFSSSLFDNLLGSNSPLTDMFYTKSTRLSTLYCYVTAYNKGISNRSTQQINCIVSKVYIS